ncbi:MAG: enoyl-CoA hydratase/isomerase family protein [Myxococcota bacterium]|nr:enoyl-CoA hydratase [Spirochaeta sp.]RPG05493.1 MAG: enoyl-CoA hydratase [Proteobacteria bacterium TMED72]
MSPETAPYENILYQVEDGIAIITLNRPDRLNAYTPAMGNEVVEAFRSARDDEDVRVILLTGAGRAFCAGVDLEVLAESNAQAEEQSEGPALGEEDFIRSFPLEMRDSSKPLIAAINGHAIGVGVTMTLPCDIRVAADDAKIGLTFSRLGILPGLGSTHLLPHLVGMARAQELILTGRIVLGQEACDLGLVQYSVPREDVIRTAMNLARQMAEADPSVLALARKALQEGPLLSLEEAMSNEQKLSRQLRESRDPTE